MANYLVHHGIKGQKWGVRNGPPYPLDNLKVFDCYKNDKGRIIVNDRSAYGQTVSEIEKKYPDYFSEPYMQDKTRSAKEDSEITKEWNNLVDSFMKNPGQTEVENLNHELFDFAYSVNSKLSAKERIELSNTICSIKKKNYDKILSIENLKKQEYPEQFFWDYAKWEPDDYFYESYLDLISMELEDLPLHVVQHSGILGQKWGHRNGPPYPLGQSQKSATEKRLAALSKSYEKRHTGNRVGDDEKLVIKDDPEIMKKNANFLKQTSKLNARKEIRSAKEFKKSIVDLGDKFWKDKLSSSEEKIKKLSETEEVGQIVNKLLNDKRYMDMINERNKLNSDYKDYKLGKKKIDPDVHEELSDILAYKMSTRSHEIIEPELESFGIDTKKYYVYADIPISKRLEKELSERDGKLEHSGILGQKWGHRNGPPYPLGTDQKSKEERRLERADKRFIKKNDKKIRRYAEKATKSQMREADKTLRKLYKTKTTRGKVARNYATAYNKILADLMNTAIGDIETPSGRVVKFVAKRGEIGVYTALADRGYDLKQLKNGVYASGKVAYKKEEVSKMDIDD